MRSKYRSCLCDPGYPGNHRLWGLVKIYNPPQIGVPGSLRVVFHQCLFPVLTSEKLRLWTTAPVYLRVLRVWVIVWTVVLLARWQCG